MSESGCSSLSVFIALVVNLKNSEIEKREVRFLALRNPFQATW